MAVDFARKIVKDSDAYVSALHPDDTDMGPCLRRGDGQPVVGSLTVPSARRSSGP